MRHFITHIPLSILILWLVLFRLEKGYKRNLCWIAYAAACIYLYETASDGNFKDCYISLCIAWVPMLYHYLKEQYDV